MAGEYDVGPWVERVPGAWWRATNRARHAVADVLAANDGNGYDVLVGDGAAPPRRWGWRHDPRKARNAALAALRARGLTTPPDEPEPTPAPVPHRAIVPGFWRVEGYDGLTEATRGGHVRVKAHTGEGLVVWGLSFWGETATWAYRTYGMALDEFLARYPASLWFPEVDATPATEAPTAPSKPDEGAASPAGPGEAVRPRVVEPVTDWMFASSLGRWRRYHRDPGAVGPDGYAAEVVGDTDAGYIWRVRAVNGALLATDTANNLDAAKAAADAALEAAGYVLEGGAHVDPGARNPDDYLNPQAAARVLSDEADRLRAEVARLTADLDTVAADRDRYRAGYERVGASAPGALLDRIAGALGIPGDWRDLADDVLEVTAADWREQAKRHEDAATVARGEAAVLREALARLTEQAEAVGDVARVLRCEPGDVAGAALALQRERDLARGEVAGLERALRVLAEVRRG